MDPKKQRRICRDNRFVGKKFKPSQKAYTLSIRRVESFNEKDAEHRRLRSQRKAAKRRRSKAMYVMIQSVMLAIMLIAIGKIGENIQGNVEGSEHRNAMQQFVLGATAEAYATPDRTAPPYPLDTPDRITYPESQVPSLEGLKALKALNEDFQFWLYIPDINISFYVLQAEDNDYYLRKDIYRNYLVSGSCFLDYRCDPKSMEGHTIIYGHTMNDLSVFGPLRGYLTKGFLEDHRYIYTCAEEGVTMWRIYSVYNTTTDEYYIETYFYDDEDYLNFIQDLGMKSKFQTNTQLTAEDDVLTLSTCYRPVGGAKGRLTIHAVKVGTAPLV